MVRLWAGTARKAPPRPAQIITQAFVTPGPPGWAASSRRLRRYGGVSVVSAGLAQAGVLVGYGLFGWSTTAAVALSLAVSVGPAYWLNRRYVWSERAVGRRQMVPFVGLAVVGSLAAAATTYAANRAGRWVTGDHATLTLMVDLTALATTVVVWAARYVAFDRLVFTTKPTTRTERTPR